MQGNDTLLKLLAGIDPKKPYGPELFDALARLTVFPTIEAACLRLTSTGSAEIFLVRRPDDESAYPGEWHIPGSALRPGESFDGVLSRLSEREFHCKMEFVRFVGNMNYPQEVRGHNLAMLYLCGAVSLPSLGKNSNWFPVDALPEKTVDHHRHRVIPAAFGAFLMDNTEVMRLRRL